MTNQESVEELKDAVDTLTAQVAALTSVTSENNVLLLAKAKRNRRNGFIALAIALIAALGMGGSIYANIRLNNTVNQINCRNDLRSASAAARDGDTQAIVDIFNKAIAGKLTTPTQIANAEKIFQKTIAADQATQIRITKQLGNC